MNTENAMYIFGKLLVLFLMGDNVHAKNMFINFNIDN